MRNVRTRRTLGCALSEDLEPGLGIREARRLLPTLVSEVESDGRPVRLTRHGRHVASLVGAEDAARLALAAVPPLEVPGDVVTATRIIEGLLPGGDALLPDRSSVMAMDRRRVAGGLATLLRSLFTVIRMKYPFGRITFEEENGQSEYPLSMSVADMLLHRVLNQAVAGALVADEGGEEGALPRDEDFDGSAIALIAGVLWAAQIGANPVVWRNALTVPVNQRELEAWISATYEAAEFVRSLIDGTPLGEKASSEGLFWVLEALYEPKSLVESVEREREREKKRKKRKKNGDQGPDQERE